MTSKYSLVNCWERNEQHPTNFLLPDKTAVQKIKHGDIVKLIFEKAGGGGERMWVKVVMQCDDEMMGELDSQPCVVSLNKGDNVRFKPCHVAAIWEQAQ